MRSLNFSIHVTRRNRHPPKFSREHYHFYAAATLGVGSEVGRIHVVDSDPIIYNSQMQLSVLGEEQHWAVFKNGSVNVQRPMNDLKLYQPYSFRVLAIDFGSPQLFSMTNITLVPVSVSRKHTDNPDYRPTYSHL